MRTGSFARLALPLRLPPCALRPRAIFLASQAYTLLHLLRHSPRAARLRPFLHALVDETARFVVRSGPTGSVRSNGYRRFR
jgi:hypothetical protein